MYLIQILFPLYSNSGKRFSSKRFTNVQKLLTKRFNGLTAFTRAPAEGRWGRRGGVQKDEIIIYEVMVSKLEKKWWRTFRTQQERDFAQEALVIRAQRIVKL